MNDKESSRFTISQRIVLAVVPRLVWALLWIVGLTWRFEVIAEDGVTPVVFGKKAGPEIYCFWHQCVLPCTMYFRRSGAVILISRSFDGELITRVLRLFGFDAVRGSSSRGAREGLLGLKRVIETGRTAIFTADGPLGPIYQTKLGPDQAGSSHRRTHRCFPPATGACLDPEFLGSLPHSQAVHADRGELGAVDARTRRSSSGAI